MEYELTNQTVCLSDIKNASLYFDKVVPLNLAELISVEDSNEPQIFDILHSILPSSLIDSNSPRGVNPLIIEYLSRYLVTFPSALGIFDLPNNETLEDRYKKNMPKFLSDMSNLIHSSGCSISSIFVVINS